MVTPTNTIATQATGPVATPTTAPIATPLHDMHCHLAFSPSWEAYAHEAGQSGRLLFSNTVTPEEFVHHAAAAASFGRVSVGVGLHPWWVRNECASQQIAAFEAAARSTRLIGEVGLDFGARHEDTRDAQVAVFERVAQTAADIARSNEPTRRDPRGPVVLSIHAVRSVDTVLDILDRTGCLDACACILHWFSGSDDQLRRAIACGCYFSAGMRMTGTRRGRAYVRAIPPERLLLETDLPDDEGDPCVSLAMDESLEHAFCDICQARGLDGEASEELARTMDETVRFLLGAVTVCP